MLYFIAVAGFFLALRLVYEALPYLAALVALVVGVGVPVVLCVYLHEEWEIPGWQSEGLPEWQRVGFVAAIAGACVGVLNRQLYLYLHAQEAESRSRALIHRVDHLQDQLSELQHRLARM